MINLQNVLIPIFTLVIGLSWNSVQNRINRKYEIQKNDEERRLLREERRHEVQLATLLEMQDAFDDLYDAIWEIQNYSFGVVGKGEYSEFFDFPKEILNPFYKCAARFTILRYRILDKILFLQLQQFHDFAFKIRFMDFASIMNEGLDYSSFIENSDKDLWDEMTKARESLADCLRIELKY